MTPGPGIEPGTHWWKASALTTTPTLLPDPDPPDPSLVKKEFAYPMKCTVPALQRTHLNALLCFPDRIGI